MLILRELKNMVNKSGLIYKTLVIGILTLFIGATVAPSISGYNKKTSIQSVREAPDSSPLNDDFINSYWKFDECIGNIAHDSSGHEYDGTIYGATWVTGQSGCALDFDGTNDYVDLDSYAKYYLGFNKTDDLIFSFYFKSSSTDKGIIYSSCRGDLYGYNPGFHIALASNGTIEVQMWRQMCGLLTWSNNSYNDGSWHYVEVYYNGISTIPQVYIYVDGILDTFYEKYVCAFYSDNFKYTQIGRNSYELNDYFDGIIDELKIIKYAGGNEQVPPTIDGPKYGDPDIEYEYSFTTYDPEEDNISIQIDWGDGYITEWFGLHESGEELKASHSWHEEGEYCIQAMSMDFWDKSDWSDCYVVIIGNQPPNPPIIDGPPSGKVDVEYEYTFNATDPEEDPAMYFIDWGDNSTEWTDYNPSGTDVQVKHSWSEKGNYTIKAKAVDTYGAESDWGALEVTIPRTRATSYLWFLERFPILERLLVLIRVV